MLKRHGKGILHDKIDRLFLGVVGDAMPTLLAGADVAEPLRLNLAVPVALERGEQAGLVGFGDHRRDSMGSIGGNDCCGRAVWATVTTTGG